jgi:CheY-like chemotaxis protein
MSMPSDMTGCRLLIVDDEPGDGMAIAQLARLHGCDVRVAADHGEMTALMRDWNPEMLVLDIVMPDLDGIGILQQLAEQFCRTPVLLVSAYRDRLKPAHNLGRAYGVNVVGELVKPIEPQAFGAALLTGFRRRAAGA